VQVRDVRQQLRLNDVFNTSDKQIQHSLRTLGYERVLNPRAKDGKMTVNEAGKSMPFKPWAGPAFRRRYGGTGADALARLREFTQEPAEVAALYREYKRIGKSADLFDNCCDALVRLNELANDVATLVRYAAGIDAEIEAAENDQ
jgi:hypothetical protein